MHKVVDIKTMRISDKEKINKYGSKELMYDAGKSIYESHDFKGSVAIVCGTGNNAGDGYVLASFLPDADVLITKNKVSEDGMYFLNKLNNKIIYINEEFDFNGYDIIVDCIFGTGFNKDVDEYYSKIIDNINSSNAYIISADIPSGLNGENGVGKKCVKANKTISIGFLKQGHFLNDAKNYTGRIINNNIGIDLVGEASYLLEKEDLKKLFAKRNENSNKKTFGYTAIIGGSKEYSGAIKLSNLSYSALRSGCGIAKLYVAKSIYDIVAPYALESIIVPVEDKDGKMIFTDDFKNLSNMDSIAIGMGLGESKEYEVIIKYLIDNYKCPIVIDADGINTLAKMDLSILKSNIVLTPHVKEFSRLTGKTIPEIKADSINIAKEFANNHNNCTVLLKGPSTIITNGLTTYIVDKGTVGMSTAGSGDVLSGILAGILAYSKFDITYTVAAGAYINGLAAQIGVEEENEVSLIARDTVINIKKAISEIIK